MMAMLVNIGGVVALARHNTWVERHHLGLAAFAVGVLITASTGHLLPEALELSDRAWLYTLAGIALMVTLSTATRIGERLKTRQMPDGGGIIPVLGIGIHSFVDGISYSTTFHADMVSGLLTAAGLILHEIPEGIIADTLLVGSGRSPGTALSLSILITAATTPMGMLTSYPFIAELDGIWLGNMLAATAGILVYVALGHLLPRLLQDGSMRHGIGLAAGAAISAIGIFLAH